MGKTARFSNIDDLVKVRLSKNPGSADMNSPLEEGVGGCYSFPGSAGVNSPLEGSVGGRYSSPGSAGVSPASSKIDSELSWIAGITFSVPKKLLEQYCSSSLGAQASCLQIEFPVLEEKKQAGRLRSQEEKMQAGRLRSQEEKMQARRLRSQGSCTRNNEEYHLNIDAIRERERVEIVSQLRTCRMFTDVPLSSKLPFSYQLIPQFLRIAVARFIGRKERNNVQRWAKFPSFPLDLSVDALSDILAIRYKKLRPTPVVLTHDIDNPASFQKLPAFLREEEKIGARSTNFIVPFKWPFDHNMVSEIKQQGHEIGIHGFDHGNKTPFLPEVEITQRIEQMSRLMERYEVKGYRSPSLLRTKKLLRRLSGTFKYDSSISTSGGLFPVPNNGCATARIFEYEGLYEFPLSLPSDAKLFLLGYKPHEIIKLWLDCAEIIHQSGGVVVLLIHSDSYFFGNKAMFSLYRELLQHFSIDARFTFKTFEELL